jgi:hypothetical protein
VNTAKVSFFLPGGVSVHPLGSHLKSPDLTRNPTVARRLDPPLDPLPCTTIIEQGAALSRARTSEWVESRRYWYVRVPKGAYITDSEALRRKKTTTCTFHCATCGLHFHSLNAFDAHRKGDYASNDPELGRHCEHPLDLNGVLAALTDQGECRISGAKHGGSRVKARVTVWTHAADLARLRHLVASGASYGAETAADDEKVEG